MNALKFVATFFALAAGVANADVKTASGTGSFALFSGYGFSYEVMWDGGPIDYRLNVSSFTEGVYPITARYQDSRASVTLSLAPTNPLPAGLDSLDLSVSMTLKYINLTSGALELPPQFMTPPALENVNAMTFFNYSRSVNGNYCFESPAKPIELRFSNGSCQFSSGFAPGSSAATPFPLEASSFTTIKVRSGHFLSASDDPSCASLTCMKPGNDAIASSPIFLQGTALITTVDEPAALYMSLAGLMALGWRARRSQRSASF